MKLIHERTYPIINKNMSDGQIGARRNRSVRDHLFVLNSILSDVMSSTKKEPIDLQIMDYKQMFDAEELETVLNAYYDSGVDNDLFALINEANETNTIAVKTPNGLTETRNIKRKIMQGDVLAPLMSSNMVDVNIGKMAKVTGNIYLYKGKVAIPPLAMQDDTLGISTCGEKSIRMNEFLNSQTNRMQLQYGTDKCVKMHIAKKHKPENCPDICVESWRDEVRTTQNGKEVLRDVYEGNEIMKSVKEKKYLGNIISHDLRNKLNIKDRTNKAVGNVNKILAGLNERPYGKNTFRAAKIMREAMLVGPLLNNSETWINVTKEDINSLEMPITMLHKQLFTKSGNPCKVFMYLEFGVIPVKFVIMGNRLKYLNHILNENIESTTRQVFETQKEDSKNGDFVDLVTKDKKELKIDLTEEEIKSMNKNVWKIFVDKQIKEVALKYLKEENSKMKKTKHIHFEQLKMSDYLFQNKQTSTTKIIFGVRSGTLDIKIWNPWKYTDLLCVGCGLEDETITHFVTCEAYGETSHCDNLQEMYNSNAFVQSEIAHKVKKRLEIRERIIEADEAGQDSTTPGSVAPLIC